MNSDMRVQCGATVERFAAGVALVRLLIRVNDLVTAQSTGLSKSFAAVLES